MTEIDSAPMGFGAAGRRIWSSVTEEYEISQTDAAILTEIARTADVLAELAHSAPIARWWSTPGRVRSWPSSASNA